MSREEKLKPCPFCGGRANIRATTPITGEAVKETGYGGYFVMCNNCLTSGNNYSTAEIAARNWNRRIQDESTEH